MSRTGAQWDDYEESKQHKARRFAKLQRIQGLRDLLETHESNPDNDHDYVLKLRARQELSQTNITVASIQPCTVLDPFAGSGTTGMVALELGRKAMLIELNPKYCDLIRQRCNVTIGLALA